ncbi:MAG: hypothetical protein MUC60_10515 [Oscillatoria sp. Prado101]|jgi:hypothetical protein|nr:hypothetical protein [Oscillatoria sp. Prado101]
MVICLASGRTPVVKAPLPANEVERIEALRRYQLLAPAAESAFDDLVLLAAYICGTPMALTGMVDSERCWVKLRVGWTGGGASRYIMAFCASAIGDDGVFFVADTFKEARASQQSPGGGVSSDPVLCRRSAAKALDGESCGHLVRHGLHANAL